MGNGIISDLKLNLDLNLRVGWGWGWGSAHAVTELSEFHKVYMYKLKHSHK